jgi:hypothetical protein
MLLLFSKRFSINKITSCENWEFYFLLSNLYVFYFFSTSSTMLNWSDKTVFPRLGPALWKKRIESIIDSLSFWKWPLSSWGSSHLYLICWVLCIKKECWILSDALSHLLRRWCGCFLHSLLIMTCYINWFSDVETFLHC